MTVATGLNSHRYSGEGISLPGGRFDITKATIPVLVAVSFLTAALFGGVKAGITYQQFSAERSSVLLRLDKIERKLDTALSRGSPANSELKGRRVRDR